ncbi:MAG: peptidylprolyl isomerase [Gemmataceae bacterium]|nr:peptidylprolyl isomerase [Gemmataceae bacterium]MCI0738823.1 peptidylprolyl isomerase [Gemmataceae bacterium]
MLGRMRQWLRPSPWLVRKGMMAAAIVAASVGAFYWGRMGATQLKATPPTSPVGELAKIVPGSTPEYAQRVVAYIHGNIPITREEYGEFLIARFGAERIEFLVNNRIVEKECRAKGIYVTDAEVETELSEQLRQLGGGTAIPIKYFVTNILKPRGKTLYEWKEDVIRPQLAVSKMVRPTIKVSDDELKQAFEARFGPKVQCRMIVFLKGDNTHKRAWPEVNQSENGFRDWARKQAIPDLASKGGEAPPIHKHFGDERIEKEAFSLKVGQVSSVMQMPDGTHVILKCDAHIPAELGKSLDDVSVRTALHKELSEIKLARRNQEVLAELRKQAAPRIELTTPVTQQNLEREVLRELTPPPPPVGNVQKEPGQK